MSQRRHRRLQRSQSHPASPRPRDRRTADRGSITQRLLNQSTRQSFQVSLIPGRMSASLREHERIVRAIDAGDGHRAERAMRTHLDAVSIDLRKVWTSRALPE
jgi:DNA-binding GntR family transcriptional regulator